MRPVVLLSLLLAPALGAQPAATARPAAPAALPAPRTVAMLPSARPVADTAGRAAAAVPDSAASATPTPETPAAPAVAPRRAALEVGVGTVRFGGLVQAWYVDGPAERVTSTFRLRRAQLKFAGEINPRASWTVMLDLAKTLRVADGRAVPASHLLQDAYVTFGAGRATVDVGQLKLPLSYEGNVVPAWRLETVERAAFVVDGKLALVREVGARVTVPVAGGSVQAGAFNGAGEGQNGQDTDDRKVVAGRVELPSVLGVRVAASGAWSHAPGEARRDRAGADARADVGPLALRAEYMRGWDGLAERAGYYGLAVYRRRAWELVGRFDSWDRDVRTELLPDALRQRDWTAGVNYLVSDTNARVQLNYVMRQVPGQPATALLLGAVQTAW